MLAVLEIDRSADAKRAREVAVSVLKGKAASGVFDVFLCHNSKDKPAVRHIGLELKKHGISPWLDESELRPGFPWQVVLEEQIRSIRSAAVFIGESGLGVWQDQEQAAFIREFVKRKCPVIPVILPGCKHVPELPVFLSGMTLVDFRINSPDPLQHLIWGISGEKPDFDESIALDLNDR